MSYDQKTGNTSGGGTKASDARDLIDLGRRLGAPQDTHPTKEPYVLVPDGFKVELLTPRKLDPLPDHIRQGVKFEELQSFIDYVKSYHRVTTRIFAKGNSAGAEFTAVFDYHEAGKDGTPQRCAHRATYAPLASVEWQRWSALAGKAMSQETLAAFIDENMPDIVAPESADLRELVLNFEAKLNVEFSSEIVRQSGARALKFVDTIEAGGKSGTIKVPELLTLRIPVFEAGRLFEPKARFSFRVTSGKLALYIEIQRTHEIIRAAVKSIIDDIEAGTGTRPLFAQLTS